MAIQVEGDANLDQMLRERFTSEFRKGYVTMDGICLPQRYEEFAKAIEDFQVKDDDVWVCSFPKTGTGPLLYILRFFKINHSSKIQV